MIISLKSTKFIKSMLRMRDSIPSWQKKLNQGFSDANALLDFLCLPRDLASDLAEKKFKTRVPLGFAERMMPGNPRDPLLLQVLAQEVEEQHRDGYVADPLEEKNANPLPGLIHKYHGRVLLTSAGACAVHCRYCFRRHFPYEDNNPGRMGWQSVLQYIENDPQIHEVILSGGDPLLVKDAVLDQLLQGIAAIPHIRVLRMHTRIPIVLPERITIALLEVLESLPLQKVVVLHSNHANELNASVEVACRALRKTGCFLLNQSVLLKDVNDNVDSLVALSERLFAYDILPYYLHLLDPVEGAAHFEVPLERALILFRQLQARLPGYLVPRLAREEPGKKHKTIMV